MHLDITCSTDDKYVQHCMAMLCSLFENNKANHFRVHLLHHGLSGGRQQLIEELCMRYGNDIIYYDVDPSKLKGAVLGDHNPDLSIATYYRILLPSLLDEGIDRLFYLDCDVIVLRDISELWQLDLEGYGIAAVRDSTPYNDRHRQLMGLRFGEHAFCAGVMMINLDYWRKHHSMERMLRFTETMSSQLMMEDQDVLNHEFRRNWFQLSYRYGRTPMSIVPFDDGLLDSDISEYAFAPSIIHYASHTKPWLTIHIPDDQYYWKYARLSGFPNPVRTKINSSKRNILRKQILRFYINRYVRPFIPDLLEMLLRDVAEVARQLSLVIRPHAFKEYLVRRVLHKYRL